LLNHKAGAWLIVRSSEPFPFGEFEFSGWVKFEVPKLEIGWELNGIRGKNNDPRLWIEDCYIKSNGAKSMFYGLNSLYADGCLFDGFGHTIADLNTHARFNGAVINTEFRNQTHDPFQNYTGDVQNVWVTSLQYEDGAHADFVQWVSTGITDIFWKDVYCGTKEKPLIIMGLRGYDVKNSYFENIKHFQYPGTGHASVDIQDATGTVFKGCEFTGFTRSPGAIYIDVDPTPTP